MKKNIYIPRRQSVAFRKAKPERRVVVEEKKTLIEICEEKGLDMRRMARLINMAFLLSDVIDGMVMDAEAELKKADPLFGLEMRHPISRIKIHTREMVRFVDETYKNDDA